MKITLKPGARLQSVACDTQIMVVKASAAELDLRCGGQPMIAAGGEVAAEELLADYAQGTLMGKRYVDSAETVEFLCIKPGAGSLAIDGVILGPKEARALPSSD